MAKSTLEKVLESPHAHLGDTVGVTLRHHDGVIHQTTCPVLRQNGGPAGTNAPWSSLLSFAAVTRAPEPTYLGEEKPTTIREYLAGASCDRCQRVILADWGPYLQGSGPLGLVREYLEAETTIRNLPKVTKATTASALHKRIASVPSLQANLRGLRSNHRADESFRVDVDRLKDALDAAIETLRGRLSGDDMRERLNQHVRDAIVPKRFKGRPFQVDETPTLIGISPARRYGGNLGAIIDTYGIRTSDHIVVLAPSFFHTYLVENLRASGSETLVLMTPATESMEVNQAAADLWSPDSNAALVDLAAAVEAAKSVIR